MIIRLIWWSLKILLTCIIVAFIANQEGNSQIVWVGWKMEIPTSILFGVFLLLIIIILWLHNLWKLIINLPPNSLFLGSRKTGSSLYLVVKPSRLLVP